MSVVKLDPAYKDYIWGGTRLREEFGKRGGERIAESWELACRKDGESLLHGTDITLSEYISRKGRSVLGRRCQGRRGFPLLIKLIDAADDLSVQVHPSDEYALIHEGESGKTEMWFDGIMVLLLSHELTTSILYLKIMSRKIPHKKLI